MTVTVVVYYEEIKRELNRIRIYECQCETGRPKDRDEVKRREI